MPYYLQAVLRLAAIHQLHAIISQHYRDILINLQNALAGVSAQTHDAEHKAIANKITVLEASQPKLQSTANGFQLLIEEDLQLAVGADYCDKARLNTPLPKDLEMKFFSPAFLGPVTIKYFRNGQKLEIIEIQYAA